MPAVRRKPQYQVSTPELIGGLTPEQLRRIFAQRNFVAKGTAFVQAGRRLPKGTRKAVRKAKRHPAMH